MSWQQVRGHEVLVKRFEQAVRRGRLAHAYLFTGPAGVGKRRFAGELAKAMLCEQRSPERLEACDRCSSCILVEAGTHPDSFQAGRPPESLEFPIDVMRELCSQLGMKPVRGRGKVAVIDDVDNLNEESANSFLKTLEEPPPQSLLILIGSSVERQLATIVSRCQVIRFQPLPENVVVELLRDQGMDQPGVAERLARLSGGSPGLAQALADPALWEFRGKLLHGLSRPRPDSVALSQELVRFVEEAGKESAAQRRRASLVLRLLVNSLSAALQIACGAALGLAEAGDLPILTQLSERRTPEELVELIQRCLDADYQSERRVQLVLVLEALLDDLCHLGA